MSTRRRRVAILGGGMGGMAAAWRLSEPGWQEDFESITVYQRGWRLGGKAASSRGPNGRIEEHGLHVWIGYYENAFRLLRELYAELDRPATDPDCPITTWREAIFPSLTQALEDMRPDGWHHWIGNFSPNDLLPGEPDHTGRDFEITDILLRGLQLVTDFLETLSDVDAEAPDRSIVLLNWLRVSVLSAILEASVQLRAGLDRAGIESSVQTLDRALEWTHEAVHELVDHDPDLRRTWHLVAVMTATVRGVLADGLVTSGRDFRSLNDEDFLDWITRHGAPEEVADFPFIRGLYDLVFAHLEDRTHHGVCAGTSVFLTTKMFFEYRGAIFWKTAAGMGDILFAPMYQALRRRGVDFEFFHRLDHLHLAPDRSRIEAVTMGRQAHLAPGVETYDPLIPFDGLPCFPDKPVVGQLEAPTGIADAPLESHFCSWPDAETRVLRCGEDFDVLVLAVSLGMVPVVCGELIEDRPEWQALIANVHTTATQAVQLWLREDEPTLGWSIPGATVSAYELPFHTWASMPHLIDVEQWPADDRPGSIGYFCGTLDAQWPANGAAAEYVAKHRAEVRANAIDLVETKLEQLLPGAVVDGSFRWDLLCGRDGHAGRSAIDTQLVLANIDPSDRYVQCNPGGDAHRLRADESGYDNLFLAGDWTDNGLNAGCIEAATLSGLRAANAVLGRSRAYRISGIWLS